MTEMSATEQATVDRSEPVTAPESWQGDDGQDELRAALVEESRAHRWGGGLAIDGHSIWYCVCGERPDDMDAHRTDSLLAVATAWVQQRARERAAEELREAADGVPRFSPPVIAEWLRDRADALADDRTGQR